MPSGTESTERSALETPGITESNPFLYRLNEPDTVFLLSSSLTEISGLSPASDGRFLLANNDEQGKIFYLDKESGEVVRELILGGQADFEGIEMAGELIFLAQSNGNIHEVEITGTGNLRTTLHKTHLKSENDVEGLGYDPANHRLLLACKGKAGKGVDYKRKRAIYAFDLNQQKLKDDPVFLIDRDEIQKWADEGKNGLTKKLAEFFEPSLADDAFAPSGIAVHPLTGEIYVLSSVGKILVVLDSTGSILHIEPLDPGLHRQPEGICFDRDGTLFISNEGKGGSGKLMRFKASGQTVN